jgi:membrane fusion protein (multidrug efflux system)
MNATTLPADYQAAGRAQLTAAAPARNHHTGRPELNGDSTPPAPRKIRRVTPKQVAAISLLIVVGLASAKFAGDWWTVGRFTQSTDDAYVGGDVTVIAPKVAGFISQIEVADNQFVHAGDLLMKLDDRDYRAALAKAGAAVALQKAALTNLDAQRDLQNAVIARAQAEIAAADAEIVRAHNDQVRYKALAANGTESAQNFDRADADYKKALADGDKTHAALTAAQQQLAVIATQKQQADAELDAANAELDLARLNLSYTELRAPIDGIVGNRSAQTGAYATIGSQLISLVPAHGLWIDANFKEDQLARMQSGNPAVVKIDLLGGKSFHGHVASIAPATGAQFSILPAENATGNFTKIVQRVAVRIVIDDENAAQGRLRPGLSVTAKVNTHGL